MSNKLRLNPPASQACRLGLYNVICFSFKCIKGDVHNSLICSQIYLDADSNLRSR